MPVRDGAQHLPEAIASLEHQRFTEFEVIVVDDGSRDQTPALLRQWSRRDPRVSVLSQPRRGIARALERGLEHTDASLVARMDADDVAHPERFALQYEAMSTDPETAVLGTHVELFPRAELSDGMKRYERWLSDIVSCADVWRELFIESPLCHPSVMVRKEALTAIGGYRDVDGPEDYDLWLRLARSGYRMRVLPQTLLRWRDRPERATRRDRRYRNDAIVRLKLRHLTGWRLRGAREIGIWGAGPFGKMWSKLLRASGLDVLFFVEVNPRKIGQRIHGAPVISEKDLPRPGEIPLLIAVGVEGARELIRESLTSRGWREPTDFLCLQ